MIKTQDYLWWSLWFCAPTNPANGAATSGQAAGRFTIQELAAKVLRWGEAHFDRDGSKRFLYARVLFCCQLFREGVVHVAKVRRGALLRKYGVKSPLLTLTPKSPSNSRSIWRRCT